MKLRPRCILEKEKRKINGLRASGNIAEAEIYEADLKAINEVLNEHS